MEIRKLAAGDRGHLEALLRETELFSDVEIACTLEIADFVLATPKQTDYDFYCAVGAGSQPPGKLLGYICFGRTPLTDAVWDIYWIVVHPDAQKKKIGSALLKFVEEVIARANGRRILIETSSTPKYEGPRAFYKRRGFEEEARVKDFYSMGDDKLIFGKTIAAQAAFKG